MLYSLSPFLLSPEDGGRPNVRIFVTLSDTDTQNVLNFNHEYEHVPSIESSIAAGTITY